MDIIHAFAMRQTQAHSDTHGEDAATWELVFKTADINGPNPESVSSTPPFHN